MNEGRVCLIVLGIGGLVLVGVGLWIVFGILFVIL